MCLALPSLVTELLPDDQARVSLGGASKVISLSLVDQVAVGDYVIVHVGYALSKVDPDEAARTLALFAASGQASYNDMAQKADPRVAALISNTFADGTFGALLSVAYSERQALEEGSNTGRWANGTSNGGFNKSSPFTGALSADTFHPRFPRYVQMEHQQKLFLCFMKRM